MTAPSTQGSALPVHVPVFQNPRRLQSQILTKPRVFKACCTLFTLPTAPTPHVSCALPVLLHSTPSLCNHLPNKQKTCSLPFVSSPGVIYCHHHNILFGAVNLQT